MRLGMLFNAKVVHFTMLLRSEPFVEKRLGNRIWTKPIVAAANLMLRMRIARRRLASLEICNYEGVFGEEFSFLDKRLSNSNLVRASRSAQDLNWRYREDPWVARLPNQANTECCRLE